jgi:chromosome segregation ATPase
MPSIGQAPAATDFVKYFTTDFLKDLGTMAQLRDELEKRQGAMSAVEAAQRDREDAAAELTKAKADAASILEDAKKKKAAADEQVALLKVREDNFEADAKAFIIERAAKSAELTRMLKAAEDREKAQQDAQEILDAKEKQMADDSDALQARIKAFQDKVAAISV